MANLHQKFLKMLPDVDYASFRMETHHNDYVELRGGVQTPQKTKSEQGYMITIHKGGGSGYSASSDTSEEGIQHALETALAWAQLSKPYFLTDVSKLKMAAAKGRFESRVEKPWRKVTLSEKLDYLKSLYTELKDPTVVDSEIAVIHKNIQKQFYSTNGGEFQAELEYTLPLLSVTTANTNESQTRTFGGLAYAQQGGFEVVERMGLNKEKTRQILEEAKELLTAPECPQQTCDVVIAPDQMILQIHESIGHPLELDRILGDERNYAGTSFVTMDMFGKFQYGSALLNITFNPLLEQEIASYQFDDEGFPAEKEFLIKNGLLVKPLGSSTSAQRVGGEFGGVANARATSWNRPPIDRMANLNLEPGDTSFEEMIAQVDDGVFLETNCSWSIDDSRNKFQFGCERARLIKGGKLGPVVKNPGYRGVSASFWQNLKAVGDAKTVEIMGTPFCGKGEPNQAIHVGHASPVCLFSGVEVFGGGV